MERIENQEVIECAKNEIERIEKEMMKYGWCRFGPNNMYEISYMLNVHVTRVYILRDISGKNWRTLGRHIDMNALLAGESIATEIEELESSQEMYSLAHSLLARRLRNVGYEYTFNANAQKQYHKS